MFDSARRDKRGTILAAVAIAAVVALLAPPAVEAATQNVKTVRGSVTKVTGGKINVKDSTGDNISSTNVGNLGLFDAPGSSGAVDARVLAGGGGLLGTGDCETTTGRPNTTTVPASANTIITGILLAGDNVRLSVAAPALDTVIGPGAVITFRTSTADQNLVAALPTGLTVTPSQLVFTCTGGDGNYVILGQ